MTVTSGTGNARILGGGHGRAIGTGGTITRAVLGGVLLGSVVWRELWPGHLTGLGLAVGLLVFPAVVLAWQWQRSRRRPSQLRATGLLATTVNCLVGLAIFLSGLYVQVLWFMSDAILAFYGGSMLIAAVRGYGGCEVLAISNWVLGRNDQIGCVVLSGVDGCERRCRKPSSPIAPTRS